MGMPIPIKLLTKNKQLNLLTLLLMQYYFFFLLLLFLFFKGGDLGIGLAKKVIIAITTQYIYFHGINLSVFSPVFRCLLSIHKFCNASKLQPSTIISLFGHSEGLIMYLAGAIFFSWGLVGL
jgi:hypothetical protein